jgi:hypothetical protein
MLFLHEEQRCRINTVLTAEKIKEHIVSIFSAMTIYEYV